MMISNPQETTIHIFQNKKDKNFNKSIAEIINKSVPVENE